MSPAGNGTAYLTYCPAAAAAAAAAAAGTPSRSRRTARPRRRAASRAAWRSRGAATRRHDLLGRLRRHLEERLRVDADPEAHDDERREREDLAHVHVLEALVLLVRDLAEEDALVEPEHVGGAEDDAEARPRGPPPVREEGPRAGS